MKVLRFSQTPRGDYNDYNVYFKIKYGNLDRSVVLICTHFMHKKSNYQTRYVSAAVEKYAVILELGCLCQNTTSTFFLQCKPHSCSWKIIVNQIWQLGTNEHRRDSCISPNVQMWQLNVTRLISFVHQTVTGTIWHTKWANLWQAIVTFSFNWRNKMSISLKNTCSKKLVLKILFCKATFHCC